ncbi:MAG TPA: methionyl-tRNA formyltransferase [Polyangia bacterium]|jgi:methionyl-tRNA formyltransferase|nr:methionyl-tRNA formyltransferase [Polyangia bacterium]
MATRGGKPRAIFFGSPAFAVPCLEATAEVADLVAVVSQPDRPAGRGNQLTPPAVKVAAGRLGAPVLQPEKIRPPEFEATLRSFAADLFVVVAYGRILPQALLDLPRLGPWNVHASLLPRLRGAAPIQWSIIGGEARTGVSIMRMEAGLDTGPVAAVAETTITDDDTTATLSARLSAQGAALLGRTLPAIVAGAVTLQRQDDVAATLAPLLQKEDGHLDFTRSSRAVSARARGVDPWPGAFALFAGQSLKLFGPRVLTAGAGGAPGTVGGAGPGGLIVACGEGAVAFAEVQLPGRKRLPAAAVLAGQPTLAGAVLR